MGSDIRVDSFSFSRPLKKEDLDTFLMEQKKQGIVEDFTYATFPLDEYVALHLTHSPDIDQCTTLMASDKGH